MFKKVVIALALALSMATAPADAGVLTDTAKKLVTAGKQAVGIGILKTSCAIDRLRGKGGGFLCGGKLGNF